MNLRATNGPHVARGKRFGGAFTEVGAVLLRLSLFTFSLLTLAAPATLANCACTPVSAPEIDAGSGLAAFAAVGGMLAYAFERRRRP